MDFDAIIREMALLESLTGPEMLRAMTFSDLEILASEIRKKIIDTVGTNGGHLASNLGVVELTLALHRVYLSPVDTLVWDVGHQCYTHKLITGRQQAFAGLRKLGGISGFPKRSESPHDAFDTGHASTSISSALGLLEARRLQNQEGRVVAVIGDGALTGGIAFEALNHAGHAGLPLTVILNDNQMSISPVVGALSRYLSILSATGSYQQFRNRVDRVVRGIPSAGPRLFSVMMRGKRAVKALFYKDNLFSDLGFEYIGPLDGHNLPRLCAVLADVRNLDRPCVVHVITTKGRGHSEAEVNPTRFHGVAPSKPQPKRPVPAAACSDDRGPVEASIPVGPLSGNVLGDKTFTDYFSSVLLDLAASRCDLVAVTAAMSKGTGLDPFQERFPARFFDVGIAEQHAVTLAGGMAAGGLLPVVAIYSTFMQRAVDQVFHDVALPGHHVIFALDRSGLVPDDGETHQGLYDLALFRTMPGMSILCPTTGEEMALFLRWAVQAPGPVMIRYPKAQLPARIPECEVPVEPGRGCFILRRDGSRILVIALGLLAASSLEVARSLEAEGLFIDLYAPRFVVPLDTEWLATVTASYEAIIVIEEAVDGGGLGEALALPLSSGKKRSYLCLAVSNQPLPQATREELLDLTGLSATCIREAILSCQKNLEVQDRQDATDAPVVPARSGIRQSHEGAA